jgi:hypothetical protein
MCSYTLLYCYDGFKDVLSSFPFEYQNYCKLNHFKGKLFFKFLSKYVCISIVYISFFILKYY